MAAEPTRGDYLAGRAAVLLRLAHQLTGDRAAALDVVARCVGRLPRHASVPDLDRVATTAIIRTARARPQPSVAAPDGWRDLAALSRGTRAAVVLAFGLGWDAESIAEARRTTPQRVRREVAHALALQPEGTWRSMFDDDRWTVPVPEDLLGHVRRIARHGRQRRRDVLMAVATVAALISSISVAVVRVVTEPPPPPPTAHVAGLLDWAPRGELIRDRSLLAAAERLWRGSRTPPIGRVYVLFAGRVGVGRLVVLQSAGPPDEAGTPAALVATVGDHDVTYRHPRLRLGTVKPMGDPRTPALVIPYDGNLGIPGLATGPGSQLDQLLVAPDVERVDVRALRTVTVTRPGFLTERIVDGVTEPWLDLVANPSTAVRISRSDGPPVTALLQIGEILPFPLTPSVLDPPAAWAGLPRPADASSLADDAVWWTQRCRSPGAQVELVWVTRAPAFPAPIRFEFVTCPGQRAVARFLTGVGAGTRVLGESGHSSDAYGVDLIPDNGGRASVAVVGSRRVVSIRYSGQEVHERTAVIPLSDAVNLSVIDAGGTQVTIR